LIDHYEADVQTAQDYYPFGMIMPGRMFTALTVPGGSVTGTTQVNGFTVPVDLALTSRSGNEPTQYVASRTIDLDEGFESGTNDDVTAYLTDTSYAGSGNGGSGPDGVAGAGKYRYGFNGKEQDNEVKGMGDQIDYGARMYDPRMARFFSVDPLIKSYPWYTSYQYAGNKPVWRIDLDGMQDEDPETVREDREELLEEQAKREELIKVGNALKGPTPEEEAKNRKDFEDFLKEPAASRGRRFREAFNAYARGAFNSAQTMFGGSDGSNGVRQFNINVSQRVINRQNARAFESIVETALKKTTDVRVSSQVTLLVTGQLDGQKVSVRIRIDNIVNNNGVLDLVESKFSVEQITGINYSKTFTGNQEKAFDIFENGNDVNIFVRGENARTIGLKPGANITGKIGDIKVVTNNPMTTQPQTVKKINVPTTPSFQNKKED
jgi:RHS repeat-associated protein